MVTGQAWNGSYTQYITYTINRRTNTQVINVMWNKKRWNYDAFDKELKHKTKTPYQIRLLVFITFTFQTNKAQWKWKKNKRTHNDTPCQKLTEETENPEIRWTTWHSNISNVYLNFTAWNISQLYEKNVAYCNYSAPIILLCLICNDCRVSTGLYYYLRVYITDMRVKSKHKNHHMNAVFESSAGAHECK